MHYNIFNLPQNLLGLVYLLETIGWLRPPHGPGHVSPWARSFVCPSPQSSLPNVPRIFSNELTCNVGSNIQTKNGGKGKKKVIPKSGQGSNLRCKPTNLSFSKIFSHGMPCSPLCKGGFACTSP